MQPESIGKGPASDAAVTTAAICHPWKIPGLLERLQLDAPTEIAWAHSLPAPPRADWERLAADVSVDGAARCDIQNSVWERTRHWLARCFRRRMQHKNSNLSQLKTGPRGCYLQAGSIGNRGFRMMTYPGAVRKLKGVFVGTCCSNEEPPSLG